MKLTLIQKMQGTKQYFWAGEGSNKGGKPYNIVKS